MGHGPRREHVPGVPPQSDWRGEGKFVWNAPYGLGPHVGGATGFTGPGGAVAADAGTGSPYQCPAYPEGGAVASAVGAGGPYGWC